jgi:hypothetical protein
MLKNQEKNCIFDIKDICNDNTIRGSRDHVLLSYL